MGELDMSHEERAARYEARRDGDVIAHIAYRRDGATMLVTSTVTAPAHRGAGVAGKLTHYALSDARARGLRVVPQCPYTADWIRRHPEFADLTA